MSHVVKIFVPSVLQWHHATCAMIISVISALSTCTNAEMKAAAAKKYIARVALTEILIGTEPAFTFAMIVRFQDKGQLCLPVMFPLGACEREA